MLVSAFLPFGHQVALYILEQMGAVVLPNVCPGLVYELTQAAEALEYVQRSYEFGQRKVQQDLAAAELVPGNLLWEVGSELEHSLNRWFGAGAFESRLCFNSRNVQRYPHQSIGIGRHRDRSNIRNLIALLGIKGEARFRVYEGVDGPVRVTLTVGPGDLLLIAAPGFGGVDTTERCYHSVDQIDGDPFRYVLGLRQVVDLEGVSNVYN